jgi:hypothetical protein
MGDRWAGAWGGPVNDSKYVWLPLSFPSSTSLSMTGYNSVDIDTATGVITGSNSGGPFDSNQNYRIVNRGSGKSLDAAGTANGSNVLQWDYWGGSNQKWKIVADNGSYRVLNVASNRALDVYQSSTADGGNVIIWDYWGSNNQKWDLVQVGNYWRIVNVNSGKSLDSSGSANGSNVQQYFYWGGSNQQWEIIPEN